MEINLIVDEMARICCTGKDNRQAYLGLIFGVNGSSTGSSNAYGVSLNVLPQHSVQHESVLI
jgi:hypothetical protein